MQHDLRFKQRVREVALGHFDCADIAEYLQGDPANRKGAHDAGVEGEPEEADAQKEQARGRQCPTLLGRLQRWQILRRHRLAPSLIHKITHPADRRFEP